MPINFIVTDGALMNCVEAISLSENINAELMFADRAHNTNEILSYLNQ